MIKTSIIPALGILAAHLAAADDLPLTGADGGPGNRFETDDDAGGFLNLADLAGLQTDDVAAIANRVPQKGLWNFKGESVKITGGGKNEDGTAKPFKVTFIHEILGGKSTDPTYDNEKMIGRKIRQPFTIWPSDFSEGIGLLKGMYAKIGIGNTGPRLGGVEGQEPGWLDNFYTAEGQLKITHGEKNGDTRAYFDWLAPEQPKESGE